jgi:hypothetical protein
MSNLSTADKIALYGGGGLVMLGVLVIGLLDMFLGAGHPVDSEGAIVHDALIPIDLRAYLILLGLLILGLYAVYRLVGPAATAGPASTVEPETAD